MYVGQYPRNPRQGSRWSTANTLICCLAACCALGALLALVIVAQVETSHHAHSTKAPRYVCGSFSDVPLNEQEVVAECAPRGQCFDDDFCLQFFNFDGDEIGDAPNGMTFANTEEGECPLNESCDQVDVLTCELEVRGVTRAMQCVEAHAEENWAALKKNLEAMETRLERRAAAVSRVGSQRQNVLTFDEFRQAPRTLAGAVVELRQSDFEHGTVRIQAPCTLVLVEDIEFNPNAAHDFRPTEEQRHSGEYPFHSGFALDFFAAITIETHDVLLDLNNHQLRAGRGWHTHQAFGILVELGNAPFVTGEGPAVFGDFQAARNVVIRNGVLGFNPHHAIHGNGAENVYIHDVVCERYHIAGIALNGARNAWVRDVQLTGTNDDLAVLGTFSQARFLLRFLERAAPLHAPSTAAMARLRALVQQARGDVLAHNRIDEQTHAEAYALFANKERLVDGNAFGLVLTNFGAGVVQFDDAFEASGAGERIMLERVRIDDTLNSVQEFVGMLDADGQYLKGPAGDLIGFQRLVGANAHAFDALVNAQFAYAAAYERHGRAANWHVGTLNVPLPLVEWWEAGANMAQLGAVMQTHGYHYAGNTDAMAHVNKGVTGLRIDSVHNVRVRDVVVEGVETRGATGFAQLLPGQAVPLDPSSYTDRTGGHPDQESAVGYAGNNARGLLIAAVQNVDLSGLRVSDVQSATGYARRYDTFPHAHDLFNVILNREAAVDMMAGGASAPANDADVLVGGAGYSAVSFANQLQQRGVSFRLVEATDHVGGRLICKRFGLNAKTGTPYCVEAGGNWVQGLNGNPVWCEALKYGLEGNAQNFDDITYYREDGTPDDANALYNRGSACEREFVAYLEAGAISERCLQPSAADNPPKSVDRRFCETYFGAPFEYSDDDDISNDRAQMLSSVAFDPITDPEPAEARACDVYSQDFEWAQFPNITSANNTLPPNTYSFFRDADYWVGGGELGYSRLPKKLLAEFVMTSVNTANEVIFDDPEQLELQSKVLEVHWDPSGAAPVEVVVCDTAKLDVPNEPVRWECIASSVRTLRANEFVSTFSLGVLQASLAEEDANVPLGGSRDTAPRFSPPLSSVPALNAALRVYPMAQYSKIFFRFEHKFWDDAQLTVSAYSQGRWRGEFGTVWQQLDIEANPNRFLPGSRTIFVTVLGERAIDVHQKTDAQVIAEFLPQLNQMFGARIQQAYGRPLLAQDVLEFSMTRWIADPLQRGMYSNMAANVSWTQIEPTRQRYGNLVFSGEHTCFRFNGYTHGALLGGKRSAGILLAERYGFEDADDEQSLCDVVEADVDPCAQGYVPPGRANRRKRQMNGGQGNNYNPPGHRVMPRGVKRNTDLSDAEIARDFAQMGSVQHRTA